MARPNQSKFEGRPSTFTQARADRILERLRIGGTRIGAAQSGGISYQTFLRWVKEDSAHQISVPDPDRPGDAEARVLWTFAEAVEKAESDAEINAVASMAKALKGYDAGYSETTKKTVFRVKKTTLPDGTVIEEPVSFEETTTMTRSGKEFDWKAGESWLKRRRRADFGDRQDITSGDMPIDTPIIVLQGVSVKDL